MSLKVLLLFGLVHCIYCEDAPQVTVSEGTLQGSILQTVALNKTYYSFKGVPYAKAPVGELRFKAPQAPESWSGVRNATEHGSACPQYDIFQEIWINGTGDCLLLNIYSPNLNPETLYDVLFFIHGGGFKSGSGDSNFYGPDFFIEKDVIVVTINYRLDALGFLCLDSEIVPGNMGMKDQVAALKWVNTNIEKFGGDPNKITIMGQSAGAESVALHLVSPMSKGLFQRAICMSGAPKADFTMTFKPRLRAHKLGLLLGMETSNDTELLEFLRSAPVMSLINANVALLGSEVLNNNNVLKHYDFIAVKEQDFGTEQFLTVDPVEAFTNGDIHDVDIMFGTTILEGVTGVPYFVNSIIKTASEYKEVLVPKEILYSSSPDIVMEVSDKIRQRYFGDDAISIENMKDFVNFASDTYLSAAVHRAFSLLPSSNSSKRYSYVFSSVSSRNYFGNQGVPYGIYAPGHVDDLFYLFQPNVLNMSVDVDSDEYQMINLTTTIYTNFIKYGNPTPDSSLGITWPEYDGCNRSYVNIANNTLTVDSNFLNETIEFLKEVFALADLDF